MEWYEDGNQTEDCWMCGCNVSVPERKEQAPLLDQPLTGGVYCRSCREAQFLLCTECSARYAVDGHGLCDVCMQREVIPLDEPW